MSISSTGDYFERSLNEVIQSGRASKEDLGKKFPLEIPWDNSAPSCTTFIKYWGLLNTYYADFENQAVPTFFPPYRRIAKNEPCLDPNSVPCFYKELFREYLNKNTSKTAPQETQNSCTKKVQLDRKDMKIKQSKKPAKNKTRKFDNRKPYKTIPAKVDCWRGPRNIKNNCFPQQPEMAMEVSSVCHPISPPNKVPQIMQNITEKQTDILETLKSLTLLETASVVSDFGHSSESDNNREWVTIRGNVLTERDKHGLYDRINDGISTTLFDVLFMLIVESNQNSENESRVYIIDAIDVMDADSRRLRSIFEKGMYCDFILCTIQLDQEDSTTKSFLIFDTKALCTYLVNPTFPGKCIFDVKDQSHNDDDDEDEDEDDNWLIKIFNKIGMGITRTFSNENRTLDVYKNKEDWKFEKLPYTLPTKFKNLHLLLLLKYFEDLFKFYDEEIVCLPLNTENDYSDLRARYVQMLMCWDGADEDDFY